MLELSLISQVSLYVLLGTIGLICMIVWVWQIGELKGKAMKNPDGSFDTWHEQKTHYWLALQDRFLKPYGLEKSWYI